MLIIYLPSFSYLVDCEIIGRVPWTWPKSSQTIYIGYVGDKDSGAHRKQHFCAKLLKLLHSFMHQGDAKNSLFNTHTIHGNGILTYMNGWCLWFSFREIYNRPMDGMGQILFNRFSSCPSKLLWWSSHIHALGLPLEHHKKNRESDAGELNLPACLAEKKSTKKCSWLVDPTYKAPTKIKRKTTRATGWLIGILIMAYYNPYITG